MLKCSDSKLMPRLGRLSFTFTNLFRLIGIPPETGFQG